MPKTPAHLRSLPPALAASLTPEASRELADYRTGQERRRRARDAGGWAADPGGVPPFLQAAEAEASGAADLWRRLPMPGPGGGFSDAEVLDAGKKCGLSAESTREALDALRRAELVAFASGGGVVTVGPAGVDG
ncbi:hypothetical protein [Rubricoccus marinus]|uniref:Uncharacterized protein n=1 Tax=Rubricoccus marinus TaxID=716817 RepID=A0A259U1V1_9BACT|nr:hypothetical protein [Rubricoccus marinus]OZC04015.1 hypothetical protein BSZ36_14105 [Rubricoccus marinus]